MVTIKNKIYCQPQIWTHNSDLMVFSFMTFYIVDFWTNTSNMYERRKKKPNKVLNFIRSNISTRHMKAIFNWNLLN